LSRAAKPISALQRRYFSSGGQEHGCNLGPHGDSDHARIGLGLSRPSRRVTYRDLETGKRLKFLTSNFALPALTIAQIYKRRWEIELFFAGFKMHLRIKRLRNQPKRRQNPDLDRGLGLCTGGHRAQKAPSGGHSLPTSTGLSVTPVRETPILQALQLDNSQTSYMTHVTSLIYSTFNRTAVI